MTTFVLDPRLRDDTHGVVDLHLCSVLLTDDSRYPWTILVPRIAGARELIDLDSASSALLLAEVDRVSRAVHALFAPDKQNIATLGNVVEQLHVHVIARYRNDAAWPRPVWGVGERVAYAPPVVQERLAALRDAIGFLAG